MEQTEIAREQGAPAASILAEQSGLAGRMCGAFFARFDRLN